MDDNASPLISFQSDICNFFAGVDSCISSHVRPDGIGFGEVACTELMAMCLSPYDAPAGLGFTAGQLEDYVNEGLTELGVDGTFKTTCSFTKFSQNHEGAITQSDFAVRLKVSDSSDPRQLVREEIYFFQAKILKNGNKYELSNNQKWRIDKLREIVGSGRLLYCLYNPMDNGVGVTIAPGHPVTRSVEHYSWWKFMAQLFMASQGGETERRSLQKQAGWRRLLIENNAAANRKIARILGTEAKKWVPYEPAVMTLGFDFPAYECRKILASKLNVSASPSTPAYGSPGKS